MTRLIYTWTDNRDSFRNFKTYPEVIEYQKIHGGRFKATYIEDKDVDYVAPNPNRKSYAKRLIAY
jgi:hypothetical protein